MRKIKFKAIDQFSDDFIYRSVKPIHHFRVQPQ